MDDTVKYYIYISDTKVDMLYPQIPRKLLENIASELSINLNFLGTGASATVKSNQSEQTRFSKLKVITKYIEKHLNVGTVDAPQAYIKGTVMMKWGTRGGIIALFTGGTAHTDIVLTGSAQHLLVEAHTSGSPRGSTATTLMEMISEIYERGEGLSLTASRDQPVSWGQSVVRTNEWSMAFSGEGWSEGLARLQGLYRREFLSKWPVQRLEFLAKTLVQRQFTPPGSENKRLLLVATPIYIAFAD